MFRAKRLPNTFLPLKYVFLLCLCIVSTTSLAQGDDINLNPLSSYVIEGKPVKPWTLAIGDNKDHYTPFTGMKTTSKTKKVIIQETSRNRKRDAIALKWKAKSGFGSFAIGGNMINLSSMEDKAALAIDMRKDGKIKGGLGVSMMCEYPCRGAIAINAMIESFDDGEWFTLPIPLKCFTNAGADLSKIDTPFHIESHGRAQLSISHVRLIKLPAGFEDMCQTPGE